MTTCIHHKLYVCILAALISGCASSPVVSNRVSSPVPPELLELPPRPVPPSEITSQREVAIFILELDAYSRRLELIINSIKTHLFEEKGDENK